MLIQEISGKNIAIYIYKLFICFTVIFYCYIITFVIIMLFAVYVYIYTYTGWLKSNSLFLSDCTLFLSCNKWGREGSELHGILFRSQYWCQHSPPASQADWEQHRLISQETLGWSVHSERGDHFPFLLVELTFWAMGRHFLSNLHYLLVSGIGTATSSSCISHRSCDDEFSMTFLDRLSINLSKSSFNGSPPSLHLNNWSPIFVTCC